MGPQGAGFSLLLSGCSEGSGDEAGADDRNDEEKGGEQVEERLGSGIEDVGERAVNSAGNDPNEADGDADSADREKRCTDNDEHVTGHGLPGERGRLRRVPEPDKTFCRTGSRIGISLPIEDYGPI